METEDSKASVVCRAACPKCGSRDNVAVYSDGGEFCFGMGCGYYKVGNHSEEGERKFSRVSESSSGFKDFLTGDHQALSSRKITEETCRRWNYSVGIARNHETKEFEPVHIANYYSDDGRLEAQKLRFSGKVFRVIGKPCSFFGKHLANSGKYLVITTGEIDAMTYSQVVNYKYPVVSVPNGDSSAKKVIQKELKWLEESFEKIVLMFDQDQSGREAAAACAELFSPGKCLIAKFSEKDANELLVKGKVDELISAVFKARPYRPDSVIPGSELWSAVSNKRESFDARYPYELLNKVLYGLRLSEIVTICAGSGIGKSQLCREIAFKLLESGESIGYIALEESVRRSALGLMSIEEERPLHIDMTGISDGRLKELFDKVLNNDRVFFYDHFGSLDSDNLIGHIRFMARSLGARWVILDHISIVVSGEEEGNERRNIDNLMTKLRSLVEELNIGMILVSHLKRPDKQGHEEGAVTSLAQLRGSAGIAQLSDVVIGMERNQQDEEHKNVSTLRVLKNRYSGETGLLGNLFYNKDTGRLLEHLPFKPNEDGIY